MVLIFSTITSQDYGPFPAENRWWPKGRAYSIKSTLIILSLYFCPVLVASTVLRVSRWSCEKSNKVKTYDAFGISPILGWRIFQCWIWIPYGNGPKFTQSVILFRIGDPCQGSPMFRCNFILCVTVNIIFKESCFCVHWWPYLAETRLVKRISVVVIVSLFRHRL